MWPLDLRGSSGKGAGTIPGKKSEALGLRAPLAHHLIVVCEGGGTEQLADRKAGWSMCFTWQQANQQGCPTPASPSRLAAPPSPPTSSGRLPATCVAQGPKEGLL